jgi:hypothetical protein
MILYTGRTSNDGGVGCARVYEDISERRLETIQVVRDERVVPRDSSVVIVDRQRSSGASSNSVV